MPPNDNLSFGDVVWVSFPFTDGQTTKDRPAVVISNQVFNQNRPDVILMSITSQPVTNEDFDGMGIATLASTGLPVPSTINPVVFSLEKTKIRKQTGVLSPLDKQTLSQFLFKLFS